MSTDSPSRNPNRGYDQFDKATPGHREQLHGAIKAFTMYGALERDETTGRSATHLEVELTPDAVEVLPKTVTKYFSDIQGTPRSVTYQLSASHGDEGTDAFFGTFDFWPDSVNLRRTTVSSDGWDHSEVISYDLYEPNAENPSGIRRSLEMEEGHGAFIKGLLGEEVVDPRSPAELDRAIDAARLNLANVVNPNMTPEEKSLANELAGIDNREATDLIALLHSQTGPADAK